MLRVRKCGIAIMRIFAIICCYLCLLLIPQNGMNTHYCDNQYFDEIRQVRENSFLKISYELKIIHDSNYSAKFKVRFSACKENKMSLYCTFVWRKQSHSLTAVKWSPGNQSTCFGHQQSLNSSFLTFEIQISLLVERSMSLIKLSITENEDIFKTLRIFRLDFIHVPKVTGLTVDGHEVSGNYVTSEGQNVTVVCTFDKANPSFPFRMLDKFGRELIRTTEGQTVSHSLTTRCEGDWPVITCGGLGSDYNRSVSLLVRCAPQFVQNSTKILNLSVLDPVTFRVKAHTTKLEMCFLIHASSEDETVKEVNCTLQGSPPDLVLSLLLDKEAIGAKGKWMLVLRNEIGSTKITLSIERGRHPVRESGAAQDELVPPRDLVRHLIKICLPRLHGRRARLRETDKELNGEHEGVDWQFHAESDYAFLTVLDKLRSKVLVP